MGGNAGLEQGHPFFVISGRGDRVASRFWAILAGTGLRAR
jgi:hypothetical protein